MQSGVAGQPLARIAPSADTIADALMLRPLSCCHPGTGRRLQSRGPVEAYKEFRSHHTLDCTRRLRRRKTAWTSLPDVATVRERSEPANERRSGIGRELAPSGQRDADFGALKGHGTSREAFVRVNLLEISLERTGHVWLVMPKRTLKRRGAGSSIRDEGHASRPATRRSPISKPTGPAACERKSAIISQAPGVDSSKTGDGCSNAGMVAIL